MGLSRSGLAKAVSGAFKAIGDVAEAATLRRKGTTYNTATGAVTVANTDYVVSKAVFTSYEKMEVDKVYILATDTKMLVQQSEFSVAPSTATDVIIRGSKTYNIVRVEQDPASVLWIFQLRAPS